jgi:histidinol-phosphate/aromatic aminotransferase/cobyric acid decarboxylase-like protein
LSDLLTLLDLPGDAERIRVLRAKLEELLNRYNLRSRPSDANWVLVDAPGLRDALAPQGVIVRDCASFGLASVARIAVPNDEGLARLGVALDRVATSIHSLIEHEGKP